MLRPGRFQLDSREVCLRTVRLEASQDNFTRCLAWLSPDETARAERFHFPQHRQAFVLGRAVLRALLGSYLGIPAAGVRFVYGPQGKPALESDACALRFNASNSGNLAAYVFTTGCEIGIDIEQHRALPDFENIAHRFFSPDEAAELLGLPASEKTAAFFHCWTRKEAYIKAMGGGLAIPLDSFRVTLQPGVAARIVSLGGSDEAARGWTLDSFDPAPGYAGAVAYPDGLRPIQAGPLVSVDDLLVDCG
ncbi:MAG: 4'-phosphopantetheinyl transferase superfamily protein [Bryobacteraceae bacterium]|jgi:4'-phosphopantetheinyl transferase